MGRVGDGELAEGTEVAAVAERPVSVSGAGSHKRGGVEEAPRSGPVTPEVGRTGGAPR
jgi:hypothetical protein